ncbi:hypothetical protein [Mucilaginibacter sp.]|jgi:hypothetical protein|uniref:hypothetical protein n=1 Tax=Mucilaginibacter sp. TaxID=1882438 RepID=UPI0026175594|nr:hypothetical protein [Mucilaginibacter sp.]MDB4918756.1 hypothetical protein [Mucilaginibacter sp.]
MKLIKNKLIRITKNGLEELGYREIKDTITPAQGLYIKLVENDLYLTLGLTISRYYDSMFTASFYISKTTIWARYGGDIPKNSYQRIGNFLTTEERGILLNEEHSKEGVKDAWWNEKDEKAIKYFLETVRITESRFLGQPDLFFNIQNSKDVNELDKLAKMVIDEVDSDNINGYNYQFIPKKSIDDIPMDWFKTAERVIMAEKAILNINTVKALAADAWRQTLVKRR